MEKMKSGVLRVLLATPSAKLKKLLESMAYTCPHVQSLHTAGTIAEALRKMRRYKPDLVLVDMFLGRESGLELALQLKSTRRSPKVIVLSPTGGLAVEVAVAQSEADGFIEIGVLQSQLSAVAGKLFPHLKEGEVSCCA